MLASKTKLVKDVKRSGTGAYCAAVNCNNNRKSCPNLQFYRFPSDESRCRKWVQNSRRQDLLNKSTAYLNKNCYVCSKHFEKEFLPKFVNARSRLSKNAIPTLFDVPNPPPIVGSKRAPPKPRQPGISKKQKLDLDNYGTGDRFDKCNPDEIEEDSTPIEAADQSKYNYIFFKKLLFINLNYQIFYLQTF
ncbi:THAP domain-containing protein 1-like [Rhopilema esculentum]